MNNAKKSFIYTCLSIIVVVLLLLGFSFAFLNVDIDNSQISKNMSGNMSLEIKDVKVFLYGNTASSITIDGNQMKKNLDTKDVYNNTIYFDMKMENTSDTPMQCTYDYVWVWDDNSDIYTSSTDSSLILEYGVQIDDNKFVNVPETNKKIGEGLISSPANSNYETKIKVTTVFKNLANIDQSALANKNLKGHIEIENLNCSATSCHLANDLNHDNLVSIGDEVYCGNEGFVVLSVSDLEVELFSLQPLYFDSNVAYQSKYNGTLTSYPVGQISDGKHPLVDFSDSHVNYYNGSYMQLYKDFLEKYNLEDVEVSILKLSSLVELVGIDESLYRDSNIIFGKFMDTVRNYMVHDDLFWTDCIFIDNGNTTAVAIGGNKFLNDHISGNYYIVPSVSMKLSNIAVPSGSCYYDDIDFSNTLSSGDSVTCGDENFEVLYTTFNTTKLISLNPIDSVGGMVKQVGTANKYSFGNLIDKSNYFGLRYDQKSYDYISGLNYRLNDAFDQNIFGLSDSVYDAYKNSITYEYLLPSDYYEVYDENSNLYPYLKEYEDYLKTLGIKGVDVHLLNLDETREYNVSCSVSNNFWVNIAYDNMVGITRDCSNISYVNSRNSNYLYPVIDINSLNISKR